MIKNKYLAKKAIIEQGIYFRISKKVKAVVYFILDTQIAKTMLSWLQKYLQSE